MTQHISRSGAIAQY